MEKQNFWFSAAFLILRGKMKELNIFVDESGEQDGASLELYLGNSYIMARIAKKRSF